MENNLYANKVEERLHALNELLKSGKEPDIIEKITPIWQEYWFGSPNAWLAFVGSSPGNSPGQAYEPFQFPSFLNSNNHLKTYCDKKKFWETLRNYLVDIFSDVIEEVNKESISSKEDQIYKLALAGNLVTTHAGNSKNIFHLLNDPENDQVNNSIQLLLTVRPRLIIALEEKVQLVVKKSLLKKGFLMFDEKQNEIKSGLSKPIAYKVNNYYFESPDGEWKFILSKTPMHPSRKNFYDYNESLAFLRETFRKSRLM